MTAHGTGQDLVDLLSTRVGEAYHLGWRVDLDDPDYHGRPHGSDVPTDPKLERAWDCAELVSWGCVHAHGVVLGVAVGSGLARDPYTGHWAADIDAGRVERVSVADAIAIPGAILLRRPGTPGASGHIEVSDGAGGTIGALGTAYGVVRGKATGRHWDDGGLIRGVKYDRTRPPVLAASMPMPPVLRVGSRGNAVLALQVRLRVLGYDPGPADGVYGARTAGAVTRYQSDRGLTPDGEAGPQTLGSLAQGR